MKRRDFLRIGAAGAATTVVGTIAGGATLLSWAPRARAATVTATLNAVAGDIPMIDHSLAYMFGFSTGNQVGFPGPTILCQEGDTVEVSVTNTLNTQISFKVGGTGVFQTISSGMLKTFSFAAPAAGSYLYYDDLNGGVNRVMGLHGALIVMPSGVTNRSFSGGPTFIRQYKWVLGNVDPVWGEAVRTNGHNYVTNSALSINTFKPRYFTINGQSYEDTHTNLNTDIRGNYNEPALVRIMNAGMATHSPHFHGNHVDIVSINRQNYSSNWKKKDIVSMFALDCRDVIYPFEVPPDAYPPLTSSSPKQTYPMHCHAEPSQTAGGGLYPHGMHTGITIGEAPPSEPQL